MAKVMVSMPDELLHRLDQEAERRRTTRSGLLQEAARRELGHLDRDAALKAIAVAREALAGGPAFDSAVLIREGRDELDRRDRRRL